MAQLNEAQKLEIVEALARFTDVTTIIRYFHDEHGLDLDHKQVGNYDPTRSYYAAGEKYREIFVARRKAYLGDLAEHPLASQGYRLGLLQEGITAARKAKNWKLVAELTEQAAREVGGVLTNQRELRVDDQRRAKPRDMTPEDRKMAMAELIRTAQEEIAAQAQTMQ